MRQIRKKLHDQIDGLKGIIKVAQNIWLYNLII
jgi:hypothetical protein